MAIYRSEIAYLEYVNVDVKAVTPPFPQFNED